MNSIFRSNRLFIASFLVLIVSFSFGCASKTKKESVSTKKQLQKVKTEKVEETKKVEEKAAEKNDQVETPKEEAKAQEKVNVPSGDEEPDLFANRPPPKAEVKEALILVRRGRYLDAIRKAKEALKKSEKYTPAMEVMARAYFKLGKQEFAEGICKTAIELNPNSGKCYNIQGFVELKRKDFPKAIAAFKKATEVEPSLGAAWLNLAAQYLRVKNYPAAEPAAIKAAELLAGRAEAHLNLGSAYRGNNKIAVAEKSYNRALALRANYPKALFNLGILYLDAQKIPGLDRMAQLAKAESYFNKYKSALPNVDKEDPVHTYLDAVAKEVKREKRRIKRLERKRKREAKRKAREAAKAAKAKEAEAAKGADAPKKEQ